MAAYSGIVTADQRLRLLQMLESDPDRTHNADVLRAGLEAAGHRGVTYLRVRELLDWLAGEGLVALEDRGAVALARLTARGEDVALGGSQVPGVARPRKGF